MAGLAPAIHAFYRSSAMTGHARRVRVPLAPGGPDMHFGAAMFFTDYAMAPGELGRALEERGFEFAMGAGAFAYSRVAGFAFSKWRRAA